ncbi:hypothetical protein SOVF_105140 [Spinacia oleracea]|uniref:Transcription termination factor MTEF1, chloroplastic-like n=1 Tax=Spinacia oleracea TaxID=3562 RepID=A0A9R0JFA0_SPIOL|nr:transcription termination factor MTEF1, chloroplastic-like [Spinacia oleracea]KNA14712.1 hypothetical protein SOVF_105140 [Spinacia oleracea]
MLKFGRICSHELQALYFIHGFFRRSLYSTLSSSSLVSRQSLQFLLADYLGFPKNKPFSSTKLSRFLEVQEAKKVSNSDFSVNVDSVVNFFKEIGLEQSQIKEVISKEPNILCAKVDKTLKPKIKLLQDLGFSRSDLVHAILANPKIFNRCLGPAIDALRDVVGTDHNVVRILKRSNWLSFSAIAKNLIPNVELLQNYGISSDSIRHYIIQQPRLFVRRTDVFQDLMIRVEEKFEIPRNSPSFLRGLYLACFKEESFKAKCDIYKSFGWTQSDVLTLIGQIPFCLGLSESRIKEKLDFLMTQLDYDPAYLASHPNLMTFSLEKRLVPRHKMLLFLKEKGLLSRDYSFYTVACWGEAMFVKKFVEPFKGYVPEIHQLYLSNGAVVPPISRKAKSL